MKLRTILIGILLSMMATPAFPCGPMNSGTGMSNNSGGGTRTMSPGRDRYTKRRMQELKRQRQQRNQHHGPDATDLISKMQQLQNPLAQTENDKRRDAQRQQQLKNVIEFLALKEERGELNPQGKAKLRQLIQQYRTNY
jgi:membrane protein involved in colicin uptake